MDLIDHGRVTDLESNLVRAMNRLLLGVDSGAPPAGERARASFGRGHSIGGEEADDERANEGGW